MRVEDFALRRLLIPCALGLEGQCEERWYSAMKLYGWLLGESLAEDTLAVNSTSLAFWPSRGIFLSFEPKYVEHIFQRMTIPARVRNCLQLYRNKKYLEMAKENRSRKYNTALECRLGVWEQTSESSSKNMLLSAFHTTWLMCICKNTCFQNLQFQSILEANV